jgi:DNA-binding NtrC family response regulator
VRQLENVLERLPVLSSGDLITVEDLPEELVPVSPSTAILWPNLPEDGISLEAIERELISRAMEKFDGNQTQAARYLDISRRTLIYRMEKHGLAADFSWKCFRQSWRLIFLLHQLSWHKPLPPIVIEV